MATFFLIFFFTLTTVCSFTVTGRLSQTKAIHYYSKFNSWYDWTAIWII